MSDMSDMSDTLASPAETPLPPLPPWVARPSWRARWVEPSPRPQEPCLTFYRLRFRADAACRVPLRVTADERYHLYLDGALVGRGSERGDAAHWYYETYDIGLAPGPHLLVAHVWATGRLAPWAQVSVRPGLLVSAEDAREEERFGTGLAAWEAFVAPGIRFADPKERTGRDLGVGPELHVDGRAFPWAQAAGGGEGWTPAAPSGAAFAGFSLYATKPLHVLHPRTLPPMLDAPWRGAARVRHLDTHGGADPEPATPFVPAAHLAAETDAWDALLRGEPGAAVAVPAHTTRRAVIDLGDYVCCYPDAAVEGGTGAELRLTYAEAPRGPAGAKADRDELGGCHFREITDSFVADGAGRALPALWWRAGRYVQVCVRTGDEALVLRRLGFVETRYPFSPEARWDAGDERWDRLFAVCQRSLLASAHETYMDAPAYEQLAYVGDSLVEMLLTYVTTRDDRLPVKTLRSFDHSRANPSGLTTSAYPSGAGQLIPPFSLLWVWAIHNHLRWRGGQELVRELLPGVRAVLDRFLYRVAGDGLLRSPAGWNWVDHSFPNWTPPSGEEGGVSGPLQWQLLLALDQAADLEDAAGEPELAARARRRAAHLFAALDHAFWDERFGIYADLPHATGAREDGGAPPPFSVHSQVFALLSGRVEAARAARIADALSAPPVPLVQPTIYFHHYLFEAAYRVRRPDWVIDRLPAWLELLDRGMRTTPENFDANARSDCHAYGASPLFHFAATLLGVRPSANGFGGVRIAPI